MNVRYSKSKISAIVGATLAVLAVSAVLPGCGGDPDCNSDALITNTQAGRDRANAQVIADEQRGTTDGASLTSQQGHDDGYALGYQEGYNSGYNSNQGYNKGYNDGVPIGIAQGQTDVGAYANGAAAGNADGRHDGIPVGNHDGYHDGYEDGYNGGFPAGQISCNNGSGGPDAEDRNFCDAQGYEGVFTAYRNSHGGKSPYQSKFDAAKAANTTYQNAFAAGRAEGVAAGTPVGKAEGYAAGKAVGINDGRAQGRQMAYQAAYNASYPGGYNDGYQIGYNDSVYGYGTAPYNGSVSNGTGGYGDGYYDGYVDGRASLCGGSAEASHTSRYGVKPATGEAHKWAKLVNGRNVDAFAVAYSLQMAAAQKTALINARVLHTVQQLESGIAPSVRDTLRTDAQASARATVGI